MVTFNLAYTAPVNPPSTTTVLTPSHLWTGLQRKVRRAYEFVPVIVKCDVVSEKENEIERVVEFQEGRGPGGKVREVCKLYAPAKIDFHQDDGTLISNIVSEGPSGKPEDLMMTYCFEWRRPDVEEGSADMEKVMEQYKKTAKMAVQGSIDTIRKFVENGEIK